MAFKNLEELAKGIVSSGQNWSDADKALAQKDIRYGNSIYTLKNDWRNAMQKGDRTAAQEIHDRAEDFRKRYGGYSGGADGSQYLRDSTYFTYEDPYEETLRSLTDAVLQYERFTSPYQQQMEQVLEQYLGREPFSYTAERDPVWQQYQKMYLREGQRAREDTLGNYAAATGGQASTAAVNAASQAQDYYNAQMSDVIPALYGQAYDRWRNEGEQYAGQLDMLRGMSSDALQAWDANRSLLTEQLSGVQRQSDVQYGRAYQKWSRDYEIERDRLDDSRYMEETAYDRAQKTQQQALSQALEWLKMGVAPEDAVISAAGLSAQAVKSYLGAMEAKLAPKSAGRAAIRASGNGSSSGKVEEQSRATPDDAGLFRDAYQSGHPENYIASHYKQYGFSKSTGLSKEYRALYPAEFTELLEETRRIVDASEYSPSAARAHLRAKGINEKTITQLMELL